MDAYSAAQPGSASHVAAGMTQNNTKEPYCCYYCGKTFTHASDLNSHARTHVGDKLFLCELCGKGFGSPESVGRHMKKCHMPTGGQWPFSCTVCGKGFLQSHFLATHSRVHTGEMPYSCQECGMKYSFLSGLKTHMMKEHRGAVNDDHRQQDVPLPGSSSAPYRCFQCRKSFASACDWEAHKCSRGGSVRRSSSDAAGTMQTSSTVALTTSLPGNSEMCGESFAPASRNLQTNFRGEMPPHTCDVCGEEFSSYRGLCSHQRTHVGEKARRCETCGENCRSSADFYRHVCRGFQMPGEKPHSGVRYDKAAVGRPIQAQSSWNDNSSFSFGQGASQQNAFHDLHMPVAYHLENPMTRETMRRDLGADEALPPMYIHGYRNVIGKVTGFQGDQQTSAGCTCTHI